MDVFYQGHWRMDWGLGNPNKTAVLIAELIVISWGLAYWKRWGFWASLIVSTILEVCLVLTYSRGGLVAMICGMGILAWLAPKPWPKARIIAGICSLAILFASAWYTKAGARYGQGMDERMRPGIDILSVR